MQEYVKFTVQPSLKSLRSVPCPEVSDLPLASDSELKLNLIFCNPQDHKINFHAIGIFDSGCTGFLMHTDYANRIASFIGVSMTEYDSEVTTADNSQTIKITHLVYTHFILKNCEASKTFSVKVFCSPQLTVPLLVGSNLLLSRHFSHFDKSGLYFFLSNDRSYLHIPFIYEKIEKSSVRNTSDFVVPPNSTLIFFAHLFDEFEIEIQGKCSPRKFIPSLESDHIHVSQVEMSDNSKVAVTIDNSSPDFFSVPPFTQLAVSSTSYGFRINDADSQYISITDEVQNNLRTADLTHQPEKRLTPHEILQHFDLSHLSPAGQSELTDIILDFHDVFSQHPTDIGTYKFQEFSVELKPDFVPTLQKKRTMMGSLKPDVEAILSQYEKAGIIEPCTDATVFVSNLLAVVKRDYDHSPNRTLGQGIRLCIDLKSVNFNCSRQATSFTPLEAVWDQLRDKKYMTVSDISSSYFSLKIEKKSRKYFAFYHPFENKIYQMCRASMGFIKSHVFLNSALTECFQGMKDISWYQDDILLASDTESEHIQLLRQFFARIRNSGLKLKLEKQVIASDKISYLGFEYSANEVSISKSRHQALSQTPPPSTRKSLVSFILALSYIRNHLPRFAVIAAPLRELLSKDTKFHWTEKHQKAFESLLEILKQNIRLTVPVPSDPFVIQTDSSLQAASGVVFQKQQGELKLCAAFSRFHQKSDQNKSICELETCSLFLLLKKFEFFLLQSVKITAQLDARSVIFLRCAKNASPVVQRRCLHLSLFNISLEHVPNENFGLPDFFTRSGAPKITTHDISKHPPLSVKESLLLVSRLQLQSGHIFSVAQVKDLLLCDNPLPSLQPKRPKKDRVSFTNEQIARAEAVFSNGAKMPNDVKRALNKRNKEFITSFRKRSNSAPRGRSSVRAFVTTRSMRRSASCKPPAERMNDSNDNTVLDFPQHLTKTLVLKKGVLDLDTIAKMQKACELCKKLQQSDKFFMTKGVLVFQSKPNDKLVVPLALIPDLLVSTHSTCHFGPSIMANKLKYFYIPELMKRVRDFCKNCTICAFHSNKIRRLPSLRHNIRPSDVRQIWSMDFCNNIGHQKENSFLIFCDVLSLYLTVVPLQSKGKSDIRRGLLFFFNAYGLPKMIRSDSEPGFFSTSVQNMFETYGIHLVNTSSFSPQGNATAENAITLFKDTLRKAYYDHPQELLLLIPQVLSHLNNRILSHSNVSPAELFYGKSTAPDQQLINIGKKVLSGSDLETEIAQFAKKRNSDLDRKIESANRKKRFTVFDIGTTCLIENCNIQKRNDFLSHTKFIGPFVIVSRCHDDSSYILRDLQTGRTRNNVHHRHIIPFSTNSIIPLKILNNTAKEALRL